MARIEEFFRESKFEKTMRKQQEMNDRIMRPFYEAQKMGQAQYALTQSVYETHTAIFKQLEAQCHRDGERERVNSIARAAMQPLHQITDFYNNYRWAATAYETVRNASLASISMSAAKVAYDQLREYNRLNNPSISSLLGNVYNKHQNSIAESVTALLNAGRSTIEDSIRGFTINDISLNDDGSITYEDTVYSQADLENEL